MPLHKKPETYAEQFALHLEMQYGLQLDAARHRLLVEELENFLDHGSPIPLPPPPPRLVHVNQNTPDAEVLGDAEFVPDPPLDKLE